LTHASVSAIYRITALWAFSEAFLGGILHALNIPFKGLILCSISVFCICMIGYYGTERNDILKALILVILVKAALSPHSPLQAYVAVLFQGLTGYLFFISRRFFKTSAVLVYVISLIETPMQKIVNVVIFSAFVFGSKFWSSVDEFMKKASNEIGMGDVNLLYIGVVIYMGIHIIVGIVLGIFVGKLPQSVNQFVKENPDYKIDMTETIEDLEVKKEKKKFKFIRIIFASLITFFFLNYLFDFFPQFIPKDASLQIVLRAVLLICFWLFVFSPLMKLFSINGWQERRTSIQLRLGIWLNSYPKQEKFYFLPIKK